ncbi:MAG: DUF350 domain-containing protein [Opitutales bacterium]
MPESFEMSSGEILMSSLLSGSINIAYAISSVALALALFWFVDHFILKSINFLDEIKKGNVAAGLFSGLIILSVALVVGLSMR